MNNKKEISNYSKTRKILIPISYIIFLIAIGIIFYKIVTNNPFSEELIDENNYKLYDSLLPLNAEDADDLELPINMDLMIKGLSYFTVAKNISHEKKREYYLKTIRTLTELISSSIIDNNDKEINSLVYFHLAYSYLLFGEEYFDISLRYFNASEKLNLKDRLLSRKKDEEKLPLLELYEVTGSIYFQLGQYENAKEYFLKAIQINNKSVIYNLILAHSYYETGYYKEAYINYKTVLENFNTTDNPIFTEELKRELFLILAKINYVLKEYLIAIDFYKDYINIYGDGAEIRYIIGKIYETLSFNVNNKNEREQYMQKAIEQWKKSLEHKPNYGKSRLKLWRYNIDL